jgi:redox-sensitive bicupin YhaK (pirin superfamily)
MLHVIDKEKRHFSDMGWLKTHWLFSFSDYYDPANVNHGALRVFNDDIVQPHSGFDIHPHEEMEIISIVLHGEMSHKDTMGNEMIIKQNDVQRMTAGTGLQHSEWNHADEPVAFFQIWILPDKKGLVPSYDQKTFSSSHWNNKLALIASSESGQQVVKLNSEASIFRANLEQSQQVSYESNSKHCQFLYIINGKVQVNTVVAGGRDQVRIEKERQLLITAQQDSGFILIDVPER